ncbi:MAG: hypothetical protein L6Q98_14745 [Anaerolineae bacterium]|nr:hypothetical protein [Anaerolineae bacterium]NUQ04060.1 hypothetical protein [Anaerolineae bacterium]
MSSDAGTSKPVFKGLAWCHEQYFSFFVPIDWQCIDRPDGKQGVIYLPDGRDEHTYLAVQVDDLGTQVTSEDMPDLVAGLLEGIGQRTESLVDSHTSAATGSLVQMEAKYTFLEGSERRRRWVRVLYHETRQITFLAQGSAEQIYRYWLPMFNEAMMTLKVHSTKPTVPG